VKNRRVSVILGCAGIVAYSRRLEDARKKTDEAKKQSRKSGRKTGGMKCVRTEKA